MSKNNSFFGKDNILAVITKEKAHIHFVGVGGVSMSSLFRLSKHFGLSVSGSDRSHGEYVDALLASGDNVMVGSTPHLPENTSLVVYSLAVSDEDSELRLAESAGVPMVSRAEYMGALMRCYGKRIGISGTHGKSTVTAMLAHIFNTAGRAPTVLSGASLGKGGEPVAFGSLDYLICEACEYKEAFLSFELDMCAFLNLEYDHVDYFKTLDSLRDAFYKAMKKTTRVIICADDPELAKIARKLDTPPVTFGKNADADYRYAILSLAPRNMRFAMYNGNKALGEISLSLIGEFNVANAAAACALALECGISFHDCARALEAFGGISRRLERIGSFDSRPLYYDYAHHPTEIREGIKAVKSDTGGKVTVIFGAHTYSRTKGLWDDFASVLSLADYTILSEICGIREEQIVGVTAEALAKECGAMTYSSDEDLVEKLRETEGAVVIMGAQDMSSVKKLLLRG